MAKGNIPLGPQPHDLVDVLCDLALAGPGVCALRALRRIGTGLDASDPNLLSAAVRIASGFRSLFNMPETIAMLRGSGEDTYWRLTLQYGINGNLQAVLDEYVHVLKRVFGSPRAFTGRTGGWNCRVHPFGVVTADRSDSN